MTRRRQAFARAPSSWLTGSSRCETKPTHFPSPTGRRCPAGADEGTCTALCSWKQHAAGATQAAVETPGALRCLPSPQPLSRRRGAQAHVPSPTGRRCPAGADEGACAASCSWSNTQPEQHELQSKHLERFAAYPHPNPSPAGEGLKRSSLLPPGEGAPKGRMRVRAQPCAVGSNTQLEQRKLQSKHLERFAAYPHPNPSPAGEGLKRTSLLPPGEGAPKGWMRVRAQPRAVGCNTQLEQHAVRATRSWSNANA